MSLIFLLVLLPLAVVAAPLYIFLRTYYGWRFGIILFVAWVASALVMPGGIGAIESLLGPIVSPYFTPLTFWTPFYDMVGFQPALLNISPDLLHWLYFGGVFVWPLHFLLMLIGRFNHLPAGHVGNGLSPQGLMQLGVFAVIFTVGAWFYIESKDLAWAILPALASMAASALLLALGGNHGRMLVLDKPIGFSFGDRTKSADPLSNRSAVSHGQLVRASSAGLETIFAQRPNVLANMAEDPPH